MSWLFALYFSFTVVNLSTMYYVYFPIFAETFRIKVLPCVEWTMFLYKTVKSWKLIAYLYIVILELKFKQYITNSCIKLPTEKNTYRLKHVINNELVMFDIVKSKVRPLNVVQYVPNDTLSSYDETSVYNESIPFMRYEALKYKPSRSISCDDTVKASYEDGVTVIYFKDGSVQQY